MQNPDRRPWSSPEDTALQSLVQDLGVKRWAEVSQLLQERYGVTGRSGKQCRERWHNHLDPSVNKEPWTEAEEKILFDGQKKFGNHWAEIAKLLPGRTDNSIKNRFYSSVRRRLRRKGKKSYFKPRRVSPECTKTIVTIRVEDTETSHAELLCHFLKTSRVNATQENTPRKPEWPGTPLQQLTGQTLTPSGLLSPFSLMTPLEKPLDRASIFQFPEEVPSGFTWDNFGFPSENTR